ncbi:TetR family transcriptional regulator [Spongiactinospora rosea]|uniref:TetR family transcriptional regulator n=1 Tax=Spongiactinospora rosea TaxID=2248750 RepID=A0A366LNN2_9ACTN|nr:TetR/AcrR family transcriptional regulator [Spongiactinospora rosea]RBQ15565.1 TetR family transcriptional regulator [Spongiactinospora rosea]
MDAGEGRRERRRIARRVAIRGVAVRLALERGGPDAVTVEEISKAADISPRTFFNHFPTKDAAFSIEPHQWTTEEIVAELRARPEGEPAAVAMREVIKAMAHAADFAHLAEEWELLQELYRRHPELFSRLRFDQVDITMAALTTEIAERIGPPLSEGIYPSVLVGAAFAALQAAENRGRVDPRPLDELIDEAFEVLIRGL